MDYETIDFTVMDGVGIIRLNRPEAGNALDLTMARELERAVLCCDETPDIRALVLTGNGKRFCVGGDLKAFAALGEGLPSYIEQVTHHFHAAISRLSRSDIPAVGVVNGAAAGGGFGLALACDLVIAAASASFTPAFTGIGLSPDSSSTYFLPRIVGLRRAKELFLANPVLSAGQALEWGLVNRVEEDGQALSEGLELAAKLAKGPARAYGAAKRLLLSSFSLSLEEQMAEEARAICALAGAGDAAEGIAAFLAKRSARFTGG